MSSWGGSLAWARASSSGVARETLSGKVSSGSAASCCSRSKSAGMSARFTRMNHHLRLSYQVWSVVYSFLHSLS